MCKKQSKNDLIIDMIRYSKNKLPKLTNYSKIFQSLKDKHDLTKDTNKQIFRYLFSKTHEMIEGAPISTFNLREEESYEYVLKTEDYFHELEYTELQEARESSKKSLKRSTIAIWISMFTMIITTAIALWGTSNVRLKEDNIESVDKALNQISEIHNLIIQKSEI